MTLLAECPVCRQPLPWTYVFRPLWSQWRCRHCSSLLGLNRGRRLLAVFPFIAIAMLAFFSFARSGLGTFAAILFILAFWLPYFLLVDRAVVLERCGFRCQRCGYDLRGQHVPRCPECARELDAAERAILETGVLPTPSRRERSRSVTVVVVVIGLITLLLGHTCLVWYTATRRRAVQRRAAAARAVASQPTSSIEKAKTDRER